MFIINALDHLVSPTSVPERILAFEEEVKEEGAEEADGDVGENDAVAEFVPRLVLGSVLK